MRNLTVAKFGGTCMGSANSIKAVAKRVLENPNIRLVVVSATSGTTDVLQSMGLDLIKGNTSLLDQKKQQLLLRHLDIGNELCLGAVVEEKIQELVESVSKVNFENAQQAQAEILSLGERLSSLILCEYMQAQLVDAREFICTNSDFCNASPQQEKIQHAASQLRQEIHSGAVRVTQGFIGRDSQDRTTVLGRGGSDLSAALFAEAIDADILEIWTDVSGILTTDPRAVSSAKTITSISFDEAAELANFGAKVLHPATVWPAVRAGIRIFVGNHFSEERCGTWIEENVEQRPIVRAIASRTDQILLTVESFTMAGASGFLARLFTTLAKHRLVVDLVTTSEVSVALTIDRTSGEVSNELLKELKSFCRVKLERELTLIALIGNHMTNTPGIGALTFGSFIHQNIRLICHGASAHNICFLVPSAVSGNMLKYLHSKFLETHIGLLSEEAIA